MVGEACLPGNAYYQRTPDYSLYSRVHLCWSEHSDSSFVYGFMSSDYGLGTMIAYYTKNTMQPAGSMVQDLVTFDNYFTKFYGSETCHAVI